MFGGRTSKVATAGFKDSPSRSMARAMEADAHPKAASPIHSRSPVSLPLAILIAPACGIVRRRTCRFARCCPSAVPFSGQPMQASSEASMRASGRARDQPLVWMQVVVVVVVPEALKIHVEPQVVLSCLVLSRLASQSSAWEIADGAHGSQQRPCLRHRDRGGTRHGFGSHDPRPFRFGAPVFRGAFSTTRSHQHRPNCGGHGVRAIYIDSQRRASCFRFNCVHSRALEATGQK